MRSTPRPQVRSNRRVDDFLARRAAVVLAVVACGWACGSRAPQATTAPSVAPIPKEACVVDGDDLDLHTLTMHSEMPSPSANGSHPFAQIWHAKHVHMDLADDKPFVRLEVETSMLRLRGVAAAEEVHFYPASASIFGEMVVPLATNPLKWRATAHGKVSISPGREPGTSVTVAPEWRSCSYLKLRPEPAFDLDKDLGLHRTQRLQLDRGGYSLFPSAEAKSSSVTLYLNGKEVIWLLEDTGKNWVKILWEASDTAFLGWVDRTAGGASLGLGSGTGSAKRPACTAPTQNCAGDLTLFSIVDGKRTEIGRVKNGAAFTVDPTPGDYAAIHVCDPDVVLIDTVVIRAGEARGCFPNKQTAPGI